MRRGQASHSSRTAPDCLQCPLLRAPASGGRCTETQSTKQRRVGGWARSFSTRGRTGVTPLPDEQQPGLCGEEGSLALHVCTLTLEQDFAKARKEKAMRWSRLLALCILLLVPL